MTKTIIYEVYDVTTAYTVNVRSTLETAKDIALEWSRKTTDTFEVVEWEAPEEVGLLALAYEVFMPMRPPWAALVHGRAKRNRWYPAKAATVV